MTPFLTTLINRAIFRVSGGEIELAKEQDNWLLVRPIKARASNDAVVDILTRMNQTQIAKFVSDNNSNPGSFGLDSPADVVTLVWRGRKKGSRSRSGARVHPIRILFMRVFRNGIRSSKSAKHLPICSTSPRMTSGIERSRG